MGRRAQFAHRLPQALAGGGDPSRASCVIRICSFGQQTISASRRSQWEQPAKSRTQKARSKAVGLASTQLDRLLDPSAPESGNAENGGS